MRIAVLADIHSNLQALEAVLADAGVLGVDGYIVAGDLISDGPSPLEVLERVKALTPWVIKGNREEYLLHHRAGLSPGWAGSYQTASLLWTYDQLTEQEWDYISGLPEHRTIIINSGIAIKVVHGSPDRINELLVPERDMDAVCRAAEHIEEQVLVCGHSHIQWSMQVKGKLLLNPGSLGVHSNSHHQAEYAILTCENGTVTAECRHVPYDVDALERLLHTSGLMEAAPHWTLLSFEGNKAGRNYCIEFLRQAEAAMRLEGLTGNIPNELWERIWRNWQQANPVFKEV